MRAVLAAAVLVLLAGCDASGPNPLFGTPGPSSSAPASNPRVLIGPSGAAQATGQWTLRVRCSATFLRVVVDDLSGPLYRFDTGTRNSGVAAATDGHTVTLSGGGVSALLLAVARDVPWRIEVEAGASTVSIDAARGSLTGFDASAGISSLDITGQRPSGTVTLRAAEGISYFGLLAPTGTGVQVAAAAGAGTVDLFDRVTKNLAAGGTVSTPGFTGGYRIEAAGGADVVFASGY